MTDEEKIFGELVARCWRDDNFKQRFMSDPKRVLAEHGMEVAPGCEIRVVEDTEKVSHIVLPVAPPKGELSDAELTAVAGGAQVGQVPGNSISRVPKVPGGIIVIPTTEPPH